MKHILIVDDEKDLAESLTYILQIEFKKESLRVHLCHSPSEAYIKAKNQKFDLIISDYNMPKTTGSELVQSILKMKHNQSVPIIMISGTPDIAKSFTQNNPFVLVVGKPFDLNEFVVIVEKLLNRTATSAA
jgi:two-component system probable response regulator PhcQ